jgi:hypothetical protein
MDKDGKIKLFKSISLNDQKCEDTFKNEQLTNELSDLISKVIRIYLSLTVFNLIYK